jgi:hypothetical protein
MGHGNGWPSRYRDSLYPATQNGFGLNPSAGSGDYDHQYFGEEKIAADIELAKNAVVLLNHLCYASGLTEPGLPEGTLSQARQRVDNFAAGFIQAGAAAVVAEAYDSPNHMLRSVLGGGRSIERAWRTAPKANGNAFAFESVRSPGYVAQMDPANETSGFERSIVLKAGLASADVLRNARGTASASRPAIVDPALLVPSLVRTGVTLAAPTFQGSTMAAGKLFYRIPFAVADRKDLPETVQASVRWDPLDPVPADPGGQSTSDPNASPDFGLIAPERIGNVVAPAKLRITRTRMSFHVATPTTPGRYRLSVTLHDEEGVAYDAATQAQVPALIVRVTGEHDAGIDAPAQMDLAPGAAGSMPVWVANLGRDPWGRKAAKVPTDASGRRDGTSVTSATNARLLGTWVALEGLDHPTEQAAALAASVTPFDLPAAMGPRSVVRADLVVFAPSAPGDYLLVLDILTPEAGSLAALGVEPTIVRVHVAKPEPVATPSTEPAPAAPAAPTTAPAPAAPGASPSPEPFVGPMG